MHILQGLTESKYNMLYYLSTEWEQKVEDGREKTYWADLYHCLEDTFYQRVSVVEGHDDPAS